MCFQVQYDPAHLSQYVQDHQVVWPELQEVLLRSGWHNYSLFYREDGLVIGYYETENESHEESCRKRAQTDADKRWQAHLRKYTKGNVAQYNTMRTLEHCASIGVC